MLRPIPLLLVAMFPLSALAQHSCSTALAVPLGIHVVDPLVGTDPPQVICTVVHQGTATHAAWYSYTADTDTIILISTNVAGQPQVNTRVHIYTGTCDALQCVVGNDDGGPNFTSRASFPVTAGETYLIAFDDRWSDAGSSFEIGAINYNVMPTETFVLFEAGFLGTAGQPLCVVDMDNDDRDDVVAVQPTFVNVNRQLPQGGFEVINLPTPQALFMPTWSMAAGDLNADGFKDLLYGNGYGVSMMLSTADGLGFTQSAGPEYVFSQRTNMVDINNDGHLDAFVCHDVAPNVFYLNDGLGNFTFNQGGLGYSCGNYGSIWVDVDNDGDQDCFVSKCGCDPSDLLMLNNGNGTFTYANPSLGPEDGHQSWSSAWGDFDNDGDMDVLIGGSASGYHKLLRNNGSGGFTNVTAGSGMDLWNYQSIEWTTHDFNNDGWLDILGGGGLLINLGDMTFLPNTYLPGNGAVGDLNSDGFLDVIGQNGLQMNVGDTNHWLRINTIGTVSNRSGIGARLMLISAMGTQIREVRSGDGFKYMSSLMVHFGLGQDTEVEELTIRWPSGIVQTVEVSAIDTVIDVVEPLTTGLVATDGPTLVLGPNPAQDVIQLRVGALAYNGPVQLIDQRGRVVADFPVSHGRLAVSSLAPGLYLARVLVDGLPVSRMFRKE